MVRLLDAREGGRTVVAASRQIPSRIARSISYSSCASKSGANSNRQVRLRVDAKPFATTIPCKSAARATTKNRSMGVTRFRLEASPWARVRQLNEAVLVADYVFQEPLLLAAGISEQGQSVAQCDGRDHQSDFIHQAELKKTLAELRTPHQPDVY